MHERKRRRERERERAREIVSSKLVKYTEDVGNEFNTVLARRVRREGTKKRRSLRYRRYYPDGRSGSASGTNKSSCRSCLRRVVKRRFDFSPSNSKTDAKANLERKFFYLLVFFNEEDRIHSGSVARHGLEEKFQELRKHRAVFIA